jgi:hypothetical protein
METGDKMTTPEEPTPTEPENSAIKEMREAMKRKDAEIAELRTGAVATHLLAIGLEPDKGLGKAIAAGYMGEVSPLAVAEFAKSEYSYEAPVENAQAQQMQQAQQRVDGFGAASTSIAPATGEDIVRAHDQKLASPDASRQDALNALEAKVQHYQIGQ